MEKGGRYLLYLRNDSEDIQVTLSTLRASFSHLSGHILICLLRHISHKRFAEFRAILCEIYAAPLLSYTLPHVHI